jgi:DNA-binding response OmpR family regulator
MPILIIEDEAAIRRVLLKYFQKKTIAIKSRDAEDGILGFEK